MRQIIDFNECLKDSPKFRAALEDAETDIDTLEAKLERLVKMCGAMIDAGKVFNQTNKQFIDSVQDLSKYFVADDMVTETLGKFVRAMEELQKYSTILLDQAHRSICKNMSTFIKTDIKRVKESRKHFEKISFDTDNAYVKSAQASKNKPAECEEAYNVLTAMKSCFAHTSLDYVFQINILHSKKRNDVLHTMLSYMHAQNAYFHQGFDLFHDLEPYMKSLATQLDELNVKSEAEKREMEGRHHLVQEKNASASSQPSLTSDDPNVKIEGYLFRRTSKGFKTWVRRWFILQNNQLVYRKRSKDNLTVFEEDLRLCTVRLFTETDRRFCFEVISPTRHHILQADTDAACQMWITAIQTGVSDAYRAASGSVLETQVNTNGSGDGNSSKSIGGATVSPEVAQPEPPKRNSRMTILFSIPGNDVCCDCGSKEPRWASINLGITLCIECSGIHRSLGVHISKVRSITLDAWEPELLKVMAELGNGIVNRIYEADVDERIAKRATADCSRNIRENWIKAKYVQKAFVRKLPQLDETSLTVSPERRRWSVSRRSKKSPSRKVAKTKRDTRSMGDIKSTGPDEQGAKMLQGTSKDSGLSLSSISTTDDVIVFGANMPEEPIIETGLPESSEDSSTETEESDTKSVTSLEDVSKLSPSSLLYKAAVAHNVAVMQEALAHGADPNWANEDEEGKNALMKAVESGSLPACEFLMLNGAKVDRKDNNAKTALHHATRLGLTAQVCQLLKRGANQHAVDADGMDPLTIAVNDANADIVTLLRLAKLNEEMRETEGLYGNPGDDTFTDVFRDFTNMASDNPEKLKRNPSFQGSGESS